MSGFKILDKDNNAISINTLDEMLAKFWNVEVQDKKYATPKGKGVNWFDMIGWAIAQQREEKPSWDDVAGYMFGVQYDSSIEDDSKLLFQIGRDITYLMPYFSALNYLKLVGCKPIRL